LETGCSLVVGVKEVPSKFRVLQVTATKNMKIGENANPAAKNITILCTSDTFTI